MSDAAFEIDPDIRLARTLPARVYSDPELFRAQRASVFARTRDFPSPADDLPRVGLGAWERFLMVSLAPAMTFEEAVAPMRARLAGLPFNTLVYDAAGARDYLVNASWALYVDNYLEGFHIPYVHSSLSATLDYGEYAVELDRYLVLQLAIAKSD